MFEGVATTVTGQAGADAAGTLALKWQGENGDGSTEIPIEIAASSHGEAIRLLEGARLITARESRHGSPDVQTAADRVQDKRLSQRLVALSSEYGLASREMALVAVVERAGDRPGEIPETRVVAVGMPGDTHFDSYFCGSPRPAMARLGSGDTGAFEVMAELAMPMGVPRYAKKASRSTRYFAPAQTDDDPFARLVQLLTDMEPDGGMPGSTLEERLRISAHALLCLLEIGHSPHAGALRSHASRLVQFLEEHQGERPEFGELVRIAKDGGSLLGAWLNVKPGSDLWPKVRTALQL
ncbi:MAG TPA: hypothetical protein VLA37_03430, partial [Sphingomonadaceae bacterium]|nr:hypothetical protein [Sphingomonadaceae bacterium]